MRSKMMSCKRGLAKTGGTTWILVTLACLLFTAAAFGQGKGKGGGGGGKESPPADPAIAVKQTGTVSKLMVMNDDGSNKTAVFTEVKFRVFPGLPSWSPGADSIAFTRSIGSQHFELWRIDVTVVDGVPQGSNLTKLFDDAVTHAWSPLGNEIAFAEGFTANPPSSLFAIPAGGGTPGELYSAPEGHVVFWPAWSPDGTRLAFVELDAERAKSIRILDLAWGTVVTTGFALGAEYDIDFLDWARTQDKLAFNVTRRDGSEPRVVFTLDITTGELVRVAEGRAPTWSPDDTRLAYNDKHGNLVSVDLATGDITKISKSAGRPDWRRF